MKLHQSGISLIELMVTVAIIAILVSVAAPSFTQQLGRQRLTGAASTLYGDLQYARSEAVQRNTQVSVTFNTVATPWCYIVHTVVAGQTCTCGATGSCTGTAVNLKNVSGTDFSGVTMAVSSGTSITFEPVRGMLTPATAVDVTFTGINSTQLRNGVSILGRVNLCSPGGTMSGYSSC